VVEFADDLITVDEWCTGGGGLVHTSKFSVFMALKVVVCIGSDFVENVFNGDIMLGRERMKYRRVVLLSLIGGGTMVHLPWVC
jgi:hypothetical protein